MLYIAYIVDIGLQSSTVRSYISAIRNILSDDGYVWDDQRMLINSLTRACKVVNDKVKTRLPINCGLLELILFELQRYFAANYQWYLDVMYRALFTLGYYGLLRVGELTDSPHVLRACNIHVGVNKQKIMLMLYTSKLTQWPTDHRKSKSRPMLSIKTTCIEIFVLLHSSDNSCTLEADMLILMNLCSFSETDQQLHQCMLVTHSNGPFLNWALTVVYTGCTV